MTNTFQRAALITKHCYNLASHEYLGKFTEQDLLDWITEELGNAQILDAFTPNNNNSRTSKAIPKSPILHILSGNTPHAGLQSLLRGILIGAHNIIKLPTPTPPHLLKWIQQLPDPLKSQVEVLEQLHDKTFHSAQTVIAIGSDLTMQEIQKRIHPNQTFIPHGHKLSIGLIERATPEAAKLIANDACQFNQQGCLSLHAVYVMNNPETLLPMLAHEMQQYELKHPRGEISISESGMISNQREVMKYESANAPNKTSITHSNENTTWTAIYKNSPTLAPSTLNRLVTIHPWPENFEALGQERHFISTLATQPHLIEHIQHLDIPRICLIGKSQQPHLTWHHDGFAPLASLIRWRDIEN